MSLWRGCHVSPPDAAPTPGGPPLLGTLMPGAPAAEDEEACDAAWDGALGGGNASVGTGSSTASMACTTPAHTAMSPATTLALLETPENTVLLLGPLGGRWAVMLRGWPCGVREAKRCDCLIE